MGRQEKGPERDYRYSEQQQYLRELASEFGVVYFRPNYHGAAGDKNTVMFYTPENHAHNEEVDRRCAKDGWNAYSSQDEARLYGCENPDYFYFQAFWSFENSDINGHYDLDFANFGKIDLRGLHWKKNLRAAFIAALPQK